MAQSNRNVKDSVFADLFSNENMPFRLLEYVTRIYEGIVPSISDRGRLGSFRMAVIY
ncbi:MAG: hypothetical protein KBT02_08435 [Treponema sp.]|nr:hypothetical protein [Candidatus Treponema caballi]